MLHCRAKAVTGQEIMLQDTETERSFPLWPVVSRVFGVSSRKVQPATHMSGSPVPRPPVQVTPAYSYLSDKIRRLSSGSVQCSLFCGGHGCKYECSERWREGDKAIRGLFSHWVTPDILAMSRPSTDLIRKGDLITEFKRFVIPCGLNIYLLRWGRVPFF